MGNLSGALTLFGRETELDLLARLASAHPIVTVTGAPGIGKSALAAAFARARSSTATVCPLTSAETPEAICRELASSLGLPATPITTDAAAAAQIARALSRAGKDLIVLDDADRACAALALLLPAWARDAPRVRFLVTARGRLRVHGAQRVDVGPLDLAELGTTNGDAIASAPAVRLFVRAARTAVPTYRLRAATAPVVAEIVRRLEGNPLAIELCASRVVVLGEAELLELLSERMDVLDGGPAALGGRSLRGAFAFSWERLADEERTFLAACSCFEGSFDLDAATAIALGGAGAKARMATATMLEGLEEASLVRAFEPDLLPGERRYALSASLGAFASEKLRSGGRDAEVARRHAAYFSSFATRRPRPRMVVLALARGDLEQALAWAVARRANPGASQPERELPARLLLAIAPLALARGPLAPFLARVDAVLGAREVSREVAAELHLTRGLALLFQGRRDDALVDLTRARLLARASKARRIETLAASKMGLISGLKGNARVSERHFQRATSLLAKSRRDPWLSGVVEKDVANVLSEQGRNDEAIIALVRARDFLHEAGDDREEGFVLMMLGSRLVDDGRLVDARRDCTAALTLLRAAGDHRSEGWAQVLLALVDAEEGDLPRARTRLATAIASFRTIGDAHTEGLALGYLGNVALEQGAMSDAEDAYREARLRLAEAGDRGSEAMCSAGSAIVELSRGRFAAARAAIARSSELLADDGRAARREAVAILGAALEGAGRPALGRGARGGAGKAGGAEEVRFARRVVAQLSRLAAPTKAQSRAGEAKESRAVVLATDGSWVRSGDGTVVRVARAGPVRRILARLAIERIRQPGQSLGMTVLVATGWPDEAIAPAAARNRLHVVIARLRRSGLEGLLVRDGDGYLLDPSVAARLAEDGERVSR